MSGSTTVNDGALFTFHGEFEFCNNMREVGGAESIVVGKDAGQWRWFHHCVLFLLL